MRKFLSTFIALTFVYSPSVSMAQDRIQSNLMRDVGQKALKQAEDVIANNTKKYCSLIKENLIFEGNKKKSFLRKGYDSNKSIEDNLKFSMKSGDFKAAIIHLKETNGFATMFKKAITDENYLNSNDFEKDCGDIIALKYADHVKEEGKTKPLPLQHANTHGHGLNWNNLPGGNSGMCMASLEKSGVGVTKVRSSCNEMENLVDKENGSAMTVLSHIATAVGAKEDKMYGLVGDDHYCKDCLGKAFRVSSGKSDKEFSKLKKDYEELLLNKLAKEKVKSGIFKFSSYLEKLEKMNNLYEGKLLENISSGQDFYCVDELNTLLRNQTNGCKQGRERFFQALEEMGVCKSSDCQKLTGEKVFKKIQRKVSTREALEPVACYTIENSQLRSTESIVNLNNLFSVLKDPKYKDYLTNNWSTLPPEYKTKKPYEKFSYFIHEMGKDSSKFPELAEVYDVIVDGFFDSSQGDKSPKRVERFFKNVFQELPELEFVFKDDVIFGQEFAKYKKEDREENFIEYVNSGLFKNDLKGSISRLKPFKEESCKELTENLKIGMCLADEGGFDQFSPADIASTSQKLMAEIESTGNTVPTGHKLALASLSCEKRNKLTKTESTIGNPFEYFGNETEISDYALSESIPVGIRESDFVKIAGDFCKESNGPVGELKSRLKLLIPNKSLESAVAHDQEMEAETSQNIENLENIIAEGASQQYKSDIFTRNLSSSTSGWGCTDGFCGNTVQGFVGIPSIPPIDIRPVGLQLSDTAPTLPSELPTIALSTPTSNLSTGSSSSEEVIDLPRSSNIEVNDSSPNEVIINPFENIMTSQSNNIASPSSYNNSYSMNNYMMPKKTLSETEEKSRVETMQNFYKDFPDTFSPEQLEGLSNGQLEELLSFAKEKNNNEKSELEAEKAKFEEEKAKFEKEKIQAEIAELQKEKKKLLEENEVITRAPAAKEGEDHSILKSSSTRDLTPKVETDKTVINNISQSADSFNRQGEASNQIGQDSFNSGSTSTSTTGVSGAMNSSTTGATIAALREYGTSYSSGGANTAEQVDSYLKYVQDNHVQASELVKRGPAGEVVELIIPNNKGELVSLDMASLSADERKKLEDKIEKLIALESQESGIKLGKGARVKAESGVLFSQVKDIDEKIFELQNQYQETYLSDLKQQLLDAIIVKK